MDRAACRIHSKTARHGTTRTASPGIETGAESLRWRSCRDGPHTSTLAFLFSPRHGTEGEWCAHGAAGVCACVRIPVWITMMQSAAVLPTESPVKSLPEILGVPLQRKTFFLNRSSDVLQVSSAGTEGWSGDEETRVNPAGCRAQANNVPSSSHKGALSFASSVIKLCSIRRLRSGCRVRLLQPGDTLFGQKDE